MATYTIVDDERFHCICGKSFATNPGRMKHLGNLWQRREEGHDIAIKYFKVYESTAGGPFVRNGPFFSSAEDAVLLLSSIKADRVFEIRATYAHTDKKETT